MLRGSRFSHPGLPLLLLWLPLPAAAQDVTVLPLTWIDAEAPKAAELPVRVDPSQPEFPKALTDTTQIGWAEIDAFVDEKGEATMVEVVASLPFYEEAASRRPAQSGKAFKPAREDGHPINARVRQVVIFNPRSAAPGKPDATPRLLSAVTIIDPKRAGPSSTIRLPSEVVWATFQLDAAARITAITGIPDRLKALLEAHLDSWRFAPARQGGRAVAAAVRAPLILVAPGGLHQKGLVPAHPIRQRPPVYPIEALRNDVTGVAVIEFTVNVAGRPTDLRTVRATLPVFASAAQYAISGWLFTPARIDGEPVPMRLEQLIGFTITGLPEPTDGGGVKLKTQGDLSKLPEALRFDTPPQLYRMVQPVYPFELLRSGVNGSAKIAIVIDPRGKVVESKIVSADRPEFGYALQAAAERFRYRPALKDGDPSSALLTVEEKFDAKASNSLIVSDSERAALKLNESGSGIVTKPSELDRKPAPAYLRPPSFPRTIATDVAGKATIEFLIDQYGVVRLPRIVSASAPEFGYAAAQAVGAWRFAPPMRKGKPVFVRVRVPIDFGSAERD